MLIKQINNFTSNSNIPNTANILPYILKNGWNKIQKPDGYPYITLDGAINILKKIIENFGTVIENRVYRGACPALEGLKALAENGIKVIIDLRHDAPASYKKQVLALGMEYINLPSFNPDYTNNILKNHKEIVKAINRAKGPVFIHCDGGNIRTGIQAALCQILKNGVNEQTAFDNTNEHDISGYTVTRLQTYLDIIHKRGISVYNSAKNLAKRL